MPEYLTFPGTVKQGNLVLESPARFSRFLKGFEGKRVELILRRRKRTRTDQQNRYYWGVIIDILGNEFGYEPEEMHSALKLKLLRVDQDQDHPIETVKSTASLSTIEFLDYIARIQRWAAQEFNIYLPDPKEVL